MLAQTNWTPANGIDCICLNEAAHHSCLSHTPLEFTFRFRKSIRICILSDPEFIPEHVQVGKSCKREHTLAFDSPFFSNIQNRPFSLGFLWVFERNNGKGRQLHHPMVAIEWPPVLPLRRPDETSGSALPGRRESSFAETEPKVKTCCKPVLFLVGNTLIYIFMPVK